MTYQPWTTSYLKGAAISKLNCSAFEAARGLQVYRICCVVRGLKYLSMSAPLRLASRVNLRAA